MCEATPWHRDANSLGQVLYLSSIRHWLGISFSGKAVKDLSIAMSLKVYRLATGERTSYGIHPTSSVKS